MSKKPKTAFSFVHLLGIGAARAEGDPDDAGDDDKRKQGEDESDEDYAKRMEKLDGADDAGADGGDDDDVSADEGGDESTKEKAARANERARCAAIFGHKAAGARPDVAAHLAFQTNMSASAAINMLTTFAAGGAAAAAAARPALASRMAVVKTPNVGASAPAAQGNPAQAGAQAILDAGKKRRGEA